MNKKTWNFKNIEEFKATSGGFIIYMNDRFNLLSDNIDISKKENLDFFRKMLLVHIFRTIWLLKYREITEILPYYFEALIHLHILYESEILNLDIENVKVKTDFSDYNLVKFIENYKKVYEKLIKTYLDKKDAWEFLSDYAVIENGIWLPKKEELKQFVENYYSLYKKIWNEI